MSRKKFAIFFAYLPKCQGVVNTWETLELSLTESYPQLRSDALSEQAGEETVNNSPARLFYLN
jgi:hypothetical protein